MNSTCVGNISFSPSWRAPLTPTIWPWQVSYFRPKLGLSTASWMRTMSLGLLKAKPGSNSQVTYWPLSAAMSQHSFQVLTTRWRAVS